MILSLKNSIFPNDVTINSLISDSNMTNLTNYLEKFHLFSMENISIDNIIFFCLFFLELALMPDASSFSSIVCGGKAAKQKAKANEPRTF